MFPLAPDIRNQANRLNIVASGPLDGKESSVFLEHFYRLAMAREIMSNSKLLTVQTFLRIYPPLV